MHCYEISIEDVDVDIWAEIFGKEMIVVDIIDVAFSEDSNNLNIHPFIHSFIH